MGALVLQKQPSVVQWIHGRWEFSASMTPTVLAPPTLGGRAIMIMFTLEVVRRMLGPQFSLDQHVVDTQVQLLAGSSRRYGIRLREDRESED